MGIENPRHLPGRRKEVLVNECVVVRKKDAKSGMGVIPTHDSLSGIILIIYGINVLPGVLSKCNVGSGLLRILALNARRDLDAVIAILSDEHAADLGLAACPRMLPDLAHNFAVNQQRGLRAERFGPWVHDFSCMGSVCGEASGPNIEYASAWGT